MQESLATPINHIIDNIYIGNLLSAIDENILLENRIESIVSVFDGFEPMFRDKYKYLHISIDDNEDVDISSYFDAFDKFITENEGKNILIHCQHGSSRSGSFVVYYLIKYHNMRFPDALKYAKEKRFCINPNKGFVKQLIFTEGLQ
jgi:protein-tyrosine phosphatase